MKIFEVEYNVCDKAYYMGIRSGYCQTKNVPDWCFEAKEAFVNVETGDDTLYYRDFKALQVRGIK